jgi:hypothetical protein
MEDRRRLPSFKALWWILAPIQALANKPDSVRHRICASVRFSHGRNCESKSSIFAAAWSLRPVDQRWYPISSSQWRLIDAICLFGTIHAFDALKTFYGTHAVEK